MSLKSCPELYNQIYPLIGYEVIWDDSCGSDRKLFTDMLMYNIVTRKFVHCDKSFHQPTPEVFRAEFFFHLKVYDFPEEVLYFLGPTHTKVLKSWLVSNGWKKRRWGKWRPPKISYEE